MKYLIHCLFLTSLLSSFAASTQVSIFTFGADSSGTRDSTAAIQRALDSDYTSIYIPAGTYLVDGLTLTKTGKHIFGDSGGQNGYQSILKAKTTNSTLLTVTIGSTLFSDITFQGEAFHPNGDSLVTGVVMDYADLDAEFDNCTFSDLRTCVNPKGRNITFKSCSFLSFWDAIVWDKSTVGGTDMRGLEVKMCRFHGARNRGIVFTPGAALFHAHIVGNMWDGFNIATPMLGEINDLHIVGDKIERVLGNCYALTNNLAGYTVGTELDPGNTIEDVKITYRTAVPWGDGILLSGPNWKVRNVDLIGAPNNAFRLNYGTNSVIQNCEINGSGTHGMIISQSPGVTVTGCRISNWGTNQVAATHYSGIYAIDVNDGITIDGCKLYSNPALALCDGISLQAINSSVRNSLVKDCYIGVYLGTSCTNVPVTGCLFYDCTSAGLSDNSDTATRQHSANTYVNCALDVYGAGADVEESFVGDSITTSSFLVGAGGTITGSSTDPAVSKVLRITKVGAGANGGLEVHVGDTSSRIVWTPSPGVTAQAGALTIWNGASLVDAIQIDTSGNITIPFNLLVAGTLSVNTLGVDNLNTLTIVVTNGITAGGNISTPTNIYGARVYVTNTVYSKEFQFRNSSGTAQSYMESGGTDGNIVMGNAAGSDFGSQIFGSASSSHFRFKKSGATMQAKLGDDSAFSSMTANGWQTANRTTAPTAASLGANGAMFWSSNAVPYYTSTVDGVTAVTKAITLTP